MWTKQECRKEALRRRSALSLEERDAAQRRIAEQLFSDDVYRQAGRILVYASYLDEVSTYGVMERAWKDGKQVFCPKIEKQPEGKRMTMVFYRIFHRDELQEGFHGIPEPSVTEGRKYNGKEVPRVGNDLILMPGTAFDRERRRLGYGGGYYDRFLKSTPHGVRIALCFSCQVLPELPEEVTDVRPDGIVTENGWIEKCHEVKERKTYESD